MYLLCPGFLFGQASDTLGLWHFDEISGSSVSDSSAYHNNGTAVGTTIVGGRFGNARNFNGFNAYAQVPNPVNGTYNFANSQSFTVSAWVKTSGAGGIIVRRGLIPVPGFNLSTYFGRAVGLIGNHQGNSWNDTLLTITSAQLINDNVWHEIRMVRDRSQGKLFLYVDGTSAATPLDDNFIPPLTNDWPLTFGASLIIPDYFNGAIDEVGILRGARHPVFTASDTVALWRYDEPSGPTVIDSSPYRNNGSALGTTVVPGQSGFARSFNGTSDYVTVPNPSNLAYNFGSGESFTVEARFKTTVQQSGWLIRRGLVPYAGFGIAISNDRVYAVIGNQEGPPPNGLMIIISDRPYTDGLWHTATLIRDRALGKLYLYIDGLQATLPLTDNFSLPLTSSEPLLMGRSHLSTLPQYFSGTLDEVRVFRGARHPAGASAPHIEVSPPQLNFGNVFVGTNAVREITVRNVGFFDTLRVSSISSNNPVFAPGTSTFSLPPGIARTVQVTYTPSAARTDTGSLSVSSNDTSRPVVRVKLSGTGFVAAAAPLITSIRDIPEDQGKQVRVIWFKSVHDSVGDSLRVGQYNLWRRVGPNNSLWDFIATIPAVRFQQYSYVAPTLFDSSRTVGIRWSVFSVSAHTFNGAQVFFSPSDSGYSVDNLAPFPPTNLAASFASGRVNLNWVAPPDPDVQSFGIHRSTTPNFLPSMANQIGTSNTPNYVDQNVVGNPVYYCVTAFDTTGNQSGPSNQVFVSITDVGNTETLPGQFQLYQNYPNPFNPTSHIRYDVANEGRVMIRLYDMLGREVLTLVDENKTAGRYDVQVNAQNLSSGVYMCRMQAGTYSSLKKMILMK